MLRKCKILVIDDQALSLPDIGGWEIEVEQFYPKYMGDDPPALKKSTQDELDRISRLSSPDVFSLIIIGNNAGEGIPRARAVDTLMKARTIIVWNNFILGQGHEAPYRAMGFRHFTERGLHGVGTLISRLLAPSG